MWEILLHLDGSQSLSGVIKGPRDRGHLEGDCYIPVDKAIETTAIVSQEDGRVVTESGSVYILDGPSRPELIIQAMREHNKVLAMPWDEKVAYFDEKLKGAGPAAVNFEELLLLLYNP